jgi:hypothetical protein
MNFNVLNDGTILTAQGIKVGTIIIDSNKYKETLINAIYKAQNVDILVDILDDISAILPSVENDSADYAIIDGLLEKLKPAQKQDMLCDIISLINYYK